MLSESAELDVKLQPWNVIFRTASTGAEIVKEAAAPIYDSHEIRRHHEKNSTSKEPPMSVKIIYQLVCACESVMTVTK